MISFLKQNPKIRVLLVEKTDRLYRNLKDWVTLDELNLEIHFVKEGNVLSENSRSSEKFMHGIQVLMAKNYIDNLSEETKKSMLEKAEQGIWPSYSPLGYNNIMQSNGKKGISIDTELAPHINQMYQWYSSGQYSIEAITRKARELGMSFRKSQNALSKSTVNKILRNRIYCGEFEWNGIVYKGTHEPIVTKELWDYVQSLIKQALGKRHKIAKHNFAFSGFIECSGCGKSLTGDIKKGKYVYYRCGGCKNKESRLSYVKEEMLAEKFAGILKGFQFDSKVLAWIAKALKASHQDKQQYHNEAVSKLQAQYSKLSARLDAMYIDKLDGRIDTTYFDTKSKEWREEQNMLLQQIQKHQNANLSYVDEGIKLIELAQNAYNLFIQQEPHEKRKLLNFVLSNSVWDGQNLTVKFKQPFDILARAPVAALEEGREKEGKNADFEKWLPMVSILRTQRREEVMSFSSVMAQVL